jgi:hypothetical protein
MEPAEEPALLSLRLLDDPPAAMLADVIERLDLRRRGPDHDDRLVVDLVRDEITDLGDFLLATHHVPDARPETLFLEARNVRAYVPVGRNEVRPDRVAVVDR